MKKIICVLITLAIAFGVMSVTAFAQDEISITVRTPLKNDISEVFTVSSSITVSDLKTLVANKSNISFSDSEGYYLYSSTKLKDDTMTLADYKITDGSVVYLEKLIWQPTADHPFEFYGLEIYGGTATNEPGTILEKVTVEFDYNFSTKVIRIKSDATTNTNIHVSGTSDCVTIISMTSRWATLTLKDANLSRDDISADADNNSGVIIVNSGRKLKINLEGNNYISNTSAKSPAIKTNSSESQLRFKSDTNGSLTVTSTGDNVPAIGAFSLGDVVKGIELQGGNITAKGGKNAPAIRTNYLQVSGGSLTANGGENSENAIEIYSTGKVKGITEGLFQTTPTAGVVTVNSKISAEQIKNAGKLVFASYDDLPDSEVYNHAVKGTVWVDESEYIWKESQNLWVKKCNHIESGILYTGAGEHTATCESAGLGHTECILCGETMNTAIAVNPTGHDIAIIDAGDNYHITICRNGCGIVLTEPHIYINSKCAVCGRNEIIADSDEEVLGEDEEVAIDIPVESITEEADSASDAEESPKTGITLGLSSMALCIIWALISKK